MRKIVPTSLPQLSTPTRPPASQLINPSVEKRTYSKAQTISKQVLHSSVQKGVRGPQDLQWPELASPPGQADDTVGGREAERGWLAPGHSIAAEQTPTKENIIWNTKKAFDNHRKP